MKTVPPGKYVASATRLDIGATTARSPIASAPDSAAEFT